MQANQYTGEVTVDIADQTCRLRYDWQAIGALQAALGTDFDKEIGRASMELDLPVIAQALAIGLEKHQPNKFSADILMALSPPVIPMIEALRQAITIAYHGSLEVPESADANPPLLTRIMQRIATWSGQRRKPPTNTA